MNPTSRHREPGKQTTLWDWVDEIEFKSAHHVSPYFGDWAEELISVVWGGTRLTTQAFRICPDVELCPGTFAEVKAISPRMCFTMYKGRYDSYKKWMRGTGSKLYFILVFHETLAAELKTLSQLKRTLPNTVHRVVVFPAQSIFKEIDRRLEENGGWMFAQHRAPAYQHYMAIKGSWFKPILNAKPYRPKRTFPCEVYGYEVGPVMIRPYNCTFPGTPNVGWHSLERREAAQVLLDELESHILDVVLSPPDKDGRCKRLVQEENVEWYKAFVAEYPAENMSRDYSIITRRQTIRTLKKIIEDKPCSPVYEERLSPYLKQAMERIKEPWDSMEEAPF